MTPEEFAARLDARWPDWSVSYGVTSQQFVAMYVGSVVLPKNTATLIANQDPELVESWMAATQSASWRARGMPRRTLNSQQSDEHPNSAPQGVPNSMRADGSFDRRHVA